MSDALTASVAPRVLAWLVAVAATLALGASAWRARGAIRAAHGLDDAATAAGWREVRGPLLAALVGQGVLLAWTPAAPWHSFFHGHERFAWLRDQPAWLDPWSGSAHGAGWYVLERVASVLTWGDPFGANAVLAVLASAAVFAWAHAVGRDAHVALAVTVLHAVLPARLRVGHALSLYVGAELVLVTAAWLAAVHVRDRSVRTLVPAVAAAVLAVHTHLELIPATPVVLVLTAAAIAPGGLADGGRRRRALLALAVAALLCLPRVAEVWMATPDHLPGVPGSDDPAQAAMRWRALAVVGVCLAWSWLPVPALAPGPAARGWLAVAAVGFALLLGAPAWVSLAQTPYAGLDRLASADHPWRLVHAWLDPDVTPPAWPWLTLFGLVLARPVAPAIARAAVAGWVGLAVFHAGTADVASTAVRSGLPAMPFLLLPAGWLVATAATRLPRGLRVLPVAVLALASWPYAGWVGWVFPTQQEHAVLVAARDAGAGVPIHVVDATDGPADAARAGVDLRAERAYLRPVLGADRDVRSLGAAPAVGGVYVRSLQCVRPVAGRGTPGSPPTLYAGGRVWSWRRALPGEDPLASLSPCWRDGRGATCDAPTAEGCARWSCTPGDPSGPAYLDPACAAFEAAVHLEPIVEVPVHAGSIQGDVIPPGVRIGVYRIVGLRGGSAGERPGPVLPPPSVPETP